MFNLIDKISLLGVTPCQDTREQNRITIMNLFFGFCGLVAVAFALYLESIIQQLIFVLTAIAFFSVLILHHYKYYHGALFLGVLSTGGAVAFMCAFQDYHSGFYLYFLTSPLMILSFYSMRRKAVLFSMIVYYGLLTALTYLFHIYGDQDAGISHEEDPIMFPINVIVAILLIVLLSYNFWKTNVAYAKHTELQNRILEEKNRENEKLLSELNDKVKNNLQNMRILSDADVMYNQAYSSSDLLLVYRSRIKTMDICFQMIYEDKIASNLWFRYFFENYCTFMQKTTIAHHNSTWITKHDIQEHSPIMRKRFDSIALLFNELCFQIMQPFKDETRIYNISISLVADIQPAPTVTITISIDDVDSLPVLSRITYQLSKLQRIALSSNLSSNRLLSIQLVIPCQ